MPIENIQFAAQQIASFLNSVVKLGGLRFKYRISGSMATPEGGPPDTALIHVELAGADAPLLVERGGELLRSLEHIAAQILHLENREADLISFDALNFKALRAQEIKLSAETAAERVRATGQPFSFPPSNSRERRMLHLAIQQIEDVESASIGEGQERYLVVYPKGRTDLPAPVPAMPQRGFGRGRYDSDNRGNRADRGDRGDRPRRDRPSGFSRR
jgi:spoIIIJ-associated protein